MTQLRFLVFALALSFAFPAAAGTPKKPDPEKEKEKVEEAIREEAKQKLGEATEAKGRKALSGKFTLVEDPANKDKPFPKPCGVLASQSGVYPVMAANEGVLGLLAEHRNQTVNVTGVIVQKSDAVVFVVDELILPPAPVQTRKKRGGLP